MQGWTKTLRGIVALAHDIFQRHWRRLLLIRERFRLSEEAFHIILAGIVGVIGGVTNLVYYRLSQAVQWVVFGRTGDLPELARHLEKWQRLLPPTFGMLAAGLVLYLGLRLIANPGLTNLLEVVVAGDGRLPFRTSLVNTLSSIFSLNTGASIGREGAIIQLSSTLASKLGQFARWPPYRLRLLVACGAASGIAASYNAPVAASVFAAQIVLGNFSMNLFAPIVFASVIASIVTRSFFGIRQWYEVPPFDFTSLNQLPWFLLLGAVSGVLGAGFLKLLGAGEKVFSKLPLPIYGRLALAGLIVGGIGVEYPEVWGNGYSSTNAILSMSKPAIPLVLGWFIAKLLATSVTVGSGTVGGIFTPTLFLGAALGSLFGGMLHLANIDATLPTGAFALVGMGSVLAATTHSPLLAMVMIFELSLNYSVMPPLMLACAISTLVARRFYAESIYTEPLRRKGLDLHRESLQLGAASEKTVGDLMRAPVEPVRENTPFREIAQRFLTLPNNFLPVVDEKKRLLGMIALQDLKEYLHAGQELDSVIAYDVMRPPPICLTPNQRLPDVLPILLASELRNVPVVNNLIQNRLIGTVARAEALSLLSEAISARSASTL